jgi:propionate CoA-transferase
MKSKVISAAEAAKLVKDGDTVLSGGFVGSAHPEAVTKALEERFLEEGSPNNLTVVFCAGQGDGKDKGTSHFGHKGMVKRGIGGHWGLAPKLGRLAVDGEIEAYNFPQGVLAHMLRDIGAGKPRTITSVGLHTYVDPRNGGGKINDTTTEDLVDLIEFDGKDYLSYRHFSPDVAIIRGTTADEAGNVSMEQEVAWLECLSQAIATKNRGGIVICQVQRLAKKNGINHHFVKIPGILVDHIVLVDPVQNPELHMQTFGTQFSPYFSGQVQYPEDSLFEAMPLNVRKLVGRRAAFELVDYDSCVVNLGIGMPEAVANVAREEGIRHKMTLTVEAGPIGGLPASGLSFGASYSPECVIDQPYMFDFYAGGGLDVAFLGAAQVDGEGNVNVSRFGPKLAGCGGFIDITQNAKKVVYCGSFTAGGLKVEARDGKLHIINEGKISKFIDSVEQVTFSGAYALEKGQPVLYVTERCVFELTADGLLLKEVAPGIDIDKDILSLMTCKPIANNPTLMDSRIFSSDVMGLS